MYFVSVLAFLYYLQIAETMNRDLLTAKFISCSYKSHSTLIENSRLNFKYVMYRSQIRRSMIF